MQKTLYDVDIGTTFRIGNEEFVKFCEVYNTSIVVSKNAVFDSRFGEKSNNFAESEILQRLNEEYLPKIAAAIGEDNICEFKTSLISLDGLDAYGALTSKISLPTFDFYRKYISIFDRYKLNRWWWLSTPFSVPPHDEGSRWVECVSPNGYVGYGRCSYCNGVRPVLNFKSSILVSCEE